MPKKGCVFNNPQLFAWADFKTKLPTQYWEWRCHVVWPSHCELTKTLGQTIVVGAYFLETVTKILIFFDNLWIIAVKVGNWIQNSSLWIGSGSRLVENSWVAVKIEDLPKGYKTLPHWHFKFISQQTGKYFSHKMGGLMSYFKGLFGSKEMRILILGLDGAGKTTLLYRLQVST